MIWQFLEHEVGEVIDILSRGATLNVDRDKAGEMLRSAAQADCCFAWRSPRGALIGLCRPAWYSDELIATDLAFYCEDGHGDKLLRAYRRWAEGRGAKEIYVSTTSGIADYDRVGNLYSRLGFPQVGTTHRRLAP